MKESDFPNPNSVLVVSGERDAFYLAHMLECIESIERYSDSNDFEGDELTQDAVLRKLQLLTESSKRISDVRKAESPQVPWRELAGFRNVVVHDYLGIRMERILPIVRRDVPALKEMIIALLSKIEKR